MSLDPFKWRRAKVRAALSRMGIRHDRPKLIEVRFHGTPKTKCDCGECFPVYMTKPEGEQAE